MIDPATKKRIEIWSQLNLSQLICIFISTVLLFGCTSTRDEVLEKKLIAELTLHKTDNVSSIDLRTTFGDQWRRICIQGPYEMQEHFEKTTGEKVKNYPSIKDNGNALLVFYKDGSMRHVEIEELGVMPNLSGGAICTSIDSPNLYLAQDKDGLKKYFFNENAS